MAALPASTGGLALLSHSFSKPRVLRAPRPGPRPLRRLVSGTSALVGSAAPAPPPPDQAGLLAVRGAAKDLRKPLFGVPAAPIPIPDVPATGWSLLQAAFARHHKRSKSVAATALPRPSAGARYPQRRRSTAVQEEEVSAPRPKLVAVALKPHVHTGNGNGGPISEDSRRLALVGTQSYMILNSDGSVAESHSIPKVAAALAIGVVPRDLRSVDPSIRSRMAAILAREGAIIINLGIVRAIIRSRCVYLFGCEEEGVKEYTAQLREFIVQTSGSSAAMPFEFRVLEDIVSHAVRGLEARGEALGAEAGQILGELEAALRVQGLESILPKLEELLPLRRKLADHEHEVREVEKAIRQILESDEDMALMYLTDNERRGGRPTEQHQALELMLEVYYSQVEEVMNDAQNLITQLGNMEEIISIHLSAVRNRIMRLELVMTGMTASVSTGALFAGVFGMNLASGFEAHPYAFYVMMASIVGMCGSMYHVFIRIARSRRLL
eukprot:tig00000241_g20949.t1